ncbi:MAG: argininosuccinate lyase [Desulfobacterales bacterium]|nr:MAG: argininosuccinate lyase [Desulfobacterales bacterium]
MSEKLWDGRFREKTARIVETFSASIDVDKRLYAYDIEGSIAHCKMLAKAAIIQEEESRTLIQGLEEIKQEIEAGQFSFDDSLEDIHMHIEARLLTKIGTVAQRLHTARSRNDQVALDVRMYLREETRRIAARLVGLQQVFVDLAKTHIEVIMPGYTHLQRAQPVLLAHHLMAYFEMFARDTQRMQGCLTRIDVMPLGAAALAGVAYPIDREYTARLLNFAMVSANSIDAVSDRDFIMEFLAAASICMVHLSRLSAELILWSSAEFGFIELPDAYATGSSIMPQKKNPDVPELVRGRTGRVVGNLMGLLTMMKSLPLAYNRDMQEDKVFLFDTVDILSACLDIYIQMLPKIKFNASSMEEAASSGFLNATDMADYLVRQGLPFREAHSVVGQAVSYALNRNKELHELTLEELTSFAALIQEDIFDFLTTRKTINRRTSYGGTAAETVKTAIAAAEEQLSRYREIGSSPQ